jgi:hypothetical protein
LRSPQPVLFSFKKIELDAFDLVIEKDDEQD